MTACYYAIYSSFSEFIVFESGEASDLFGGFRNGSEVFQKMSFKRPTTNKFNGE
jgi:hypothetical protein